MALQPSPWSLDLPLACARGLSFRAVAAGDLAFLRDLYGSTRAEELARVPWSDAQRAAFVQMQFDAQHAHYVEHYPDAAFWVVELADAAIGRLYLDVWEDEVRIIDIALMPAWRGQGFGGAMLADVLLAARDAGKAVRIHVEKTNPALRLYARLGFRVVADKGVYDLLEWRAGAAAQVNTAS